MAWLGRRKHSPNWYILDRLGGRVVSRTTGTDSLQLAKAKLREYETRKAGGSPSPLSSRTPISEVVQAYVEHIRAIKTAKSDQTDVYYLREVFGPVCSALEITSRDPARTRPKKPRKDPGDRSRRGRVRARPQQQRGPLLVALQAVVPRSDGPATAHCQSESLTARHRSASSPRPHRS